MCVRRFRWWFGSARKRMSFVQRDDPWVSLRVQTTKTSESSYGRTYGRRTFPDSSLSLDTRVAIVIKEGSVGSNMVTRRYWRLVPWLRPMGTLALGSLTLGGCLSPGFYGETPAVASVSASPNEVGSSARIPKKSKNAPEIDQRLPIEKEPISHPYPGGENGSQGATDTNDGPATERINHE